MKVLNFMISGSILLQVINTSGKPDNILYGFPDKSLVGNHYLNQPDYIRNNKVAYNSLTIEEKKHLGRASF
jgi:hypothetical protein